MVFTSLITRRRRSGPPAKIPKHETVRFPVLTQYGRRAGDKEKVVYKPTSRNLRYFSRTPIARRAINTIKNPICNFPFVIKPRKGVVMNREIADQIETAMFCFEHPNEDDSLRTFLEQLIEDWTCGAAAFEVQKSSDPLRPVWMWPTDGLSIQIYSEWDGQPNTPRYLQTLGYGSYGGMSAGISLFNDELVYVRANPNTAGPFGFGPLEVAFNTIARQISTGEFTGKLAANGIPSFMIDLGDGADEAKISAFRSYWRNDVEGEGRVPITGMGASSGGADGKTRGLSVIRTYPEGDRALYLGYQEFLKREIACAFDISPQNLALERDVNRSTAEVSADRDLDTAIKPCALSFISYLNREVLWAKMGFYNLEASFQGLDRENELRTAQIMKMYYDMNVFCPDQIRDKIGEDKDTVSQWGTMMSADVEIAKLAARNVGIIDDTDLPDSYATSGASSTPPATTTPKPRTPSSVSGQPVRTKPSDSA